MAERVFFHIGAPKTGTTFVQLAMWYNRDRLREQGVLFPGRRVDHFFATFSVRAQNFEDHHPPRARTAWTRLVNEAASWDGTVIISHEFFGAATTDQAKDAIEALAPAEVHLVLTARDYARQIPAYWQQSLKSTRYAGGLDDYVRAALADELDGMWSWLTMDAVAVLARWAKHVPPERVHVVTVPPPGRPYELLWHRYASVVGIDPDSCDLDQVRPNVSLGAVEAELLRRIKPKMPASLADVQKRHRWQRRYLTHELLVPRGGERFAIRPERAAALRELSKTAAEDLAGAGYDVAGDLGELIPPADLPALRHPEDASDAELLDAATDTIGLMLEELDRQTARAEEAERAVANAQKPALAERSKRDARGAALRGGTDKAAAHVTTRIREVGSGASFPLRKILIDLSERHPRVMRLRVLYRKTMANTRRRRTPH